MKFFSLAIFILVVGVTIQATAQQQNKQRPDSLTVGDSLKVLPKDFGSEPLTKMPIYNPKGIDAKILMIRPKGIIDNMPILGRKDSLCAKERSSDFGKDFPK